MAALTRADSRGRWLLVSIGALAALDGLALVVSSHGARDAAAPFQVAVGGFGLGHSVTPAWSFHGVDPRGTRLPESALYPIVGLPCPDPHLGSALFDAPLAGGR